MTTKGFNKRVESIYCIFQREGNIVPFVHQGEISFSFNGIFEHGYADEKGTLNLSDLIEYIQSIIQETIKKEYRVDILKKNIYVQVNKITAINKDS